LERKSAKLWLNYVADKVEFVR